ADVEHQHRHQRADQAQAEAGQGQPGAGGPDLAQEWRQVAQGIEALAQAGTALATGGPGLRFGSCTHRRIVPGPRWPRRPRPPPAANAAPNPESRIPPNKKARRSGPFYWAEPDSERAVQILQLRLARTEVGRQVGDLLVVQVGGLRGHQRVLAGAAAVFLQGVGQVVRVLAAELGVAGVDRGIAFGTVAVDAALAGGLALGGGKLLADRGAAGRPAGGGAGRRVAFGGGGAGAATTGRQGQDGGQGEGETRGVHGFRHGRLAAYLMVERKAEMSAMSCSVKLCAWARMVGCRRLLS